MILRQVRRSFAGENSIGFSRFFCLLQAAADRQKADTWSGSIGFTHLAPSVSGDLSPPAFAHTQADVSADTQLTGAELFIERQHGVERCPGVWALKHKITGAGAIAGAWALATTRALPITAVCNIASCQRKTKFRPYAGLGLTYAKFQNQRRGCIDGD